MNHRLAAPPDRDFRLRPTPPARHDEAPPSGPRPPALRDHSPTSTNGTPPHNANASAQQRKATSGVCALANPFGHQPLEPHPMEPPHPIAQPIPTRGSDDHPGTDPLAQTRKHGSEDASTHWRPPRHRTQHRPTRRRSPVAPAHTDSALNTRRSNSPPSSISSPFDRCTRTESEDTDEHNQRYVKSNPPQDVPAHLTELHETGPRRSSKPGQSSPWMPRRRSRDRRRNRPFAAVQSATSNGWQPAMGRAASRRMTSRNQTVQTPMRHWLGTREVTHPHPRRKPGPHRTTGPPVRRRMLNTEQLNRRSVRGRQ